MVEEKIYTWHIVTKSIVTQKVVFEEEVTKEAAEELFALGEYEDVIEIDIDSNEEILKIK